MVSDINTEIMAIKISDPCIRRISTYFRTLTLLERKGIKYITSTELAEIDGRISAQVRKDLSYFGCFGVRGLGYEVTRLKHELGRIIGMDKGWGLVVIGSTQYSEVLMNSLTLKSNNLLINKIYCENMDLNRRISAEIKIFHMDSLEETLDPEHDNIAIIALPPSEVQCMIDRLSRLGVKAAIYLASRPVKTPDNMVIASQDISIELGMLTYRLNEMNISQQNKTAC